MIKTLEQFNWNHPQKINRALVEHLFIYLGLYLQKYQCNFRRPQWNGQNPFDNAYHACCQSAHVLFRSAIEIINSLADARKTRRFEFVMKKYTACDILLIDELGYLPFDKFGADLLFQVISGRYERGPILLTTNRIFKEWPIIFNQDTTLTSAVLDQILHNCETIIIEGDSYRMRDREN